MNQKQVKIVIMIIILFVVSISLYMWYIKPSEVQSLNYQFAECGVAKNLNLITENVHIIRDNDVSNEEVINVLENILIPAENAIIINSYKVKMSTKEYQDSLKVFRDYRRKHLAGLELLLEAKISENEKIEKQARELLIEASEMEVQYTIHMLRLEE